MKRFAPLLLCLILASCGGKSETSCKTDYWDGLVGTCLPSGWEVVDRETLRQRGVPEETVVAFQAEEPVSGQFPTVAITQEQLNNPVDSEQYSNASIRSVSVLPGYEHIDTRDFDIDGVDVSLHIFSLQPIEGEPKRRFYQASTATDTSGFTATGVVPFSVDDELEDQILLLFGELTFTAPVQ